MQFPHEIQAALLFDRPVLDLEAMVRAFLLLEEGRTGVRFNMVEAKAGIFYRLFGGGDERMITFEYVDRPADRAVFKQALESAITDLMCSDIRERLARARSHILVNVSHGALGDSPQIRQLTELIGYQMQGQSLPEFKRRLDTCALLARIVGDHATPSVVHWTQSNQLIPGEIFDTYAVGDAPHPLHVHPFLFGPPARGSDQPKVGIRTFGVRHFIGREVLVQPSVLPWAANFETVLAFLRVATVENGYVIPDGDTFGPEDRSLSYRVRHRDAEAGDVPLYELEPLLHREHGFVSDDYVPPERVFDDRAPPADLVAEDDGSLAALIEEWRGKRAKAEGIGGRFEVRSRRPDGGGMPGPGGGPNIRPLFGRKR